MLADNPEAPLILIVEDDENHAELIIRSFDDAPEKCSIEIARTIREAKVVIERRSPGIVLTDYHLPDGEGIDLVLTADGAWPVVMMTSHGSEEVAVEAMKMGAYDYIVKSSEAFKLLPHTVLIALKTWSLVLARRKADEEVSRAKRDWERTFDVVPDLIAIIDSNHTITRVNKAMALRCGVAPEDLVGRKCHDVVHGNKGVPCCCPASEMMRDGTAHTREIEENSLNGFFDISISPLTDDDGRTTSFVHVMRDVSERKRAEKKLQESEKEHRRLANELRIILNTSSVGISFIKERRLLWTNPGFDRMFGYELGMTHNLETSVLYYNEESYRRVGDVGYPAIMSGEIYSEDLMMKKRDGSPLWCNLVGQAVTPHNLDDGSIWVMIDINERVLAEEDRKKVEQQFQQAQKLESLGVLAGGIAHDFNNILTIIMGHCFMVKEDFDSGMSDKLHVQQIEGAAIRAANLCRQMLAYAGKSPLQMTRVNMWTLVDDIVKMLRSAIKSNVYFDVELGHSIPEINGDGSQIQQVVMNLIINSAEAIGDSSGTIGIHLSAEVVGAEQPEIDYFKNEISYGRYVCLAVTDDGCGMTEETRQRIFEPFFTTKFTGRGLGMSAILGIIKSHDGALQLTSESGVGTTFTVFFPIQSKPEAAEIPSLANPPDSVPASGTILLVDDEHALLAIGSALLTAMGFSVLTASNGFEALEIYNNRKSEIELVLLDLTMPVMGGVESFREIRKKNGTLPIVICSGYSIEDLPEELKNDPFTTAVQKPYKPDNLRCVLSKYMNNAG